MDPKDCETLREVDAIKTLKDFKKFLKNARDEEIETLWSCLINLPDHAQTDKEKALVKKYQSVFTAAKKRSFNSKTLKVFLRKNFKLLRQVVATVAVSAICKEIASALFEQDGG